MKIIAASDSFKGSLTSLQVSQCIREAANIVYNDAEILAVPVSDGGEGIIAALKMVISSDKVEVITINVHGPIFTDPLISAQYLIINNGDNKKIAVIEMAEAAGITLIDKNRRNPLFTSTYGVGELIKDAILNHSCKEFLIGIGGSATNDAGVGMLEALGYKFFDKDNRLMNCVKIGCGKALQNINDFSFDDPVMSKLLNDDIKITVACDVQNVFCGKNGAAYIYGPQKGATKEDVKELDDGLYNFQIIIQKKLDRDISKIPGSGAAGGLGGCFLAFFKSELKKGIEIVLDIINFDDIIKGADLIITGEGKFDSQSLMGKVPVGIAERARKLKVPRIIAIVGAVDISYNEIIKLKSDFGIDGIFSICQGPITTEVSMDPNIASENIKKTVVQILSLLK